MSLLDGRGLSRFFGADEIFSGVDISVPAGARIGLVGANGSGKTSLLHILAGLDLPTAGTLSLARSRRLALLPQRPELAGDHTLWQEQLKAFDGLRRMERDLATLEERLAQAADAAALDAYGALQAEFERLGGYTYETRIRMVLSGLGFTQDEYAMPLPQLSGGQKTRALLGRLLLEAPDLLLLDEPTNHLDIAAVAWLENYLRDFPGAVIAVSHDRYFLDHFAGVIWELEAGRLHKYRGNYSAYVRGRKQRRDLQAAQYAAQQAFIKKERDYIRKHMGSRWTAQAKGRQKKLRTMQKRGHIIESAPRNRRGMSLDMGAVARSGDQALITRDLRIGYDPAQPLLDVPDTLTLRGETVAVIGPNGVGKSTLLKTITGELPPLRGEVITGAEVKLGYFAQAHEKLNARRSILDEITSVKAMPVSKARDFLGRFLFGGDDVFREIASLSGGERGRVALAKLSLLGANLLLLDEPTNHLDIDSQEALQTVLGAFSGTILLVSHDRYLIDALATQIWQLSPDGMSVFAGDYQLYLRERNQQRSAKGVATAGEGNLSARNGSRKPNRFAADKRAAELEQRVDELERGLGKLADALQVASAAADADRVRCLGQEYARTEAELAAALDEWGECVG